MRTSFKFVASSCYILILPLCAEFLNGVQGSVDIQQAITGQAASGSDFPWQEVSSHGQAQTTEGGGPAAAYLVGAWGACIQRAGQGGKELGEERCVRQREVRCTAGGVYASESTCGALTTPAAEQACACSAATSLREFLRGGAAAAAAAGEEEEEEEGTGGAAAAGAAAGGGGGDWRREPAAAPFAAVRVNPLLAGGGRGEADQNKDSAPDIAQPDRIQASPSGVPERIKLGDPSVGENGPEQVERLPGDIGAGTGSTSLALFGAGVAALLAACAAHRIRDALGLGRGGAAGDKHLPAAAYGYYNALSAADGRDPAAAAPRTAARDEAAAAAAIRNPALMSPEEFRALEDQLALEEEAAARRAMFGEGGPGHAALLGGAPPPPL